MRRSTDMYRNGFSFGRVKADTKDEIQGKVHACQKKQKKHWICHKSLNINTLSKYSVNRRKNNLQLIFCSYKLWICIKHMLTVLDKKGKQFKQTVNRLLDKVWNSVLTVRVIHYTFNVVFLMSLGVFVITSADHSGPTSVNLFAVNRSVGSFLLRSVQ